MTINRYQKVVSEHTTFALIPPPDPGYAREIATLGDGYTYVVVEGVLPPQHGGIVVEDVTLTDALREELRRESPQIQAINRDCKAAIRERYSVEDEIRALRLGGQDETDWRAYVEQCVATAEARKADWGL